MSTLLAIVTDVHADLHALRDALVQIDKLGVDQILCCGDLVDYGLFPAETLTLLRERNVVTIRGNQRPLGAPTRRRRERVGLVARLRRVP